ncbi:MAG: T9SS type A sorting domain-containing protein, partial [Bacteroidota bacterium]
NDTLCSCVTSVLQNALSVSPKLFTINNSLDSVMITASSLLFPVTSGFDWSTNGNSFSTNRQIYAGPYTTPGIYKYTARLIHNCQYYSDTVTIISGSGVPVKLMAFSAKPHHEDVDLKWQTAHEKNVAYFEIHRSGGNNEWEPIAKIKATGNSNSIKAYMFKDGAAMKRSVSRLHYKLKSVDRNGAFEWSDEAIVPFIHNEAKPAIYPNPFNGEFTVSVPSGGTTRVTISSLQGEILFTTVADPVNYKILLRNVDHLCQGIYLLKITTDDVTYTEKLVKN